MSRFKSNLYTVELRVWRNHKLCWIQNDDFTLFSGHHKTKIKEGDLPEWYVFGRYYKLWGFLSTKGITDLQYIPNLWINHFLKDDCLLISYGGKIEEYPDNVYFDKYSGVDERVWGNEILDVLKGAEKFSGYDIAPIVEQIREKQRILIENHPNEFGPQKWDFDLDKWMAREYQSGRLTYFSRAITEKREAELRELDAKRSHADRSLPNRNE